jgi:hypothetical protein
MQKKIFTNRKFSPFKISSEKNETEHKYMIEDYILNFDEIGSEGLNSFIEYKEKG